MIDVYKLEELKHSAIIVKDAVENSIINSTDYEESATAQGIALVTVCDKVVDIIDEYLAYPEECDDNSILVQLLGMDYLFGSVRRDELGYDEDVLEWIDDDFVNKHFWSMEKCLKIKDYQK